MPYSAVGTTALNDYIYVCGGYDGVISLNTVEKYCPATDKWQMLSSMNKHRSAGGVIAFEGYIYALGGHDGLSIFDSVSILLILFVYLLYILIDNYSFVYLFYYQMKIRLNDMIHKLVYGQQ